MGNVKRIFHKLITFGIITLMYGSTCINVYSNEEKKSEPVYIEDRNAEDAFLVSYNTETTIKGERHYPVRDDGRKVVYLTFDDGPSVENTMDILEVLNNYNVKATFFVTGEAIDSCEGCRELLKKIDYDGHAIGNHTYSHNYKRLYPGRRIDSQYFLNDVEKCSRSIKNVLGEDYHVKAVRFPGGYWSWQGRLPARKLLEENDYAIIDWNALCEDAQGEAKNAAQLLQRTKANVERLGPNADSIVFLMHDTYGKKETVKALGSIIEYFKEKGFEFKTIR